MTNLVPTTMRAPAEFAPDMVSLIKRTVARGATDDELKIFLHQCQKTGLDPLARQIYFQKRKNSRGGEDMTILTGIDGYRLTADRSGKYAGSDDPVFDNEDNPRKATVTVYKVVAGLRCAFTATARWEQYYPGDSQGFMWRKMPHLMLSKCAEALALRKAFPAELSGVYVKEEMDQAGPAIQLEEKRVSAVPPAFDNNNETHQTLVVGFAEQLGVTEQEDWIAIGDVLAMKRPPIPLARLEAAVKEAWESLDK